MHGAWQVQRATSIHGGLDRLVLYSSIAALYYGVAQANYASANGALDALSAYRRATGEHAVSIQWGPWADVGMAAGETINARMKAAGLGLISPSAGLTVLQLSLRPAGQAVMAMTPVHWDTLLASSIPSLLSPFAPKYEAAGTFAADGPECVCVAPAVAISLDAIRDMVKRTSGSMVDVDAPLMDAGLDSLGAVELRNQVQQAVGSQVTLPSTLIFDYPTASSLASFLTGLAPRTAARRVANMPVASPSIPQTVSLSVVSAIVKRTAGCAVDSDAPLMDAGLDSLGAVELRNHLQQEVGAASLYRALLSLTILLLASLHFPYSLQLAQHIRTWTTRRQKALRSRQDQSVCMGRMYYCRAASIPHSRFGQLASRHAI